MNDNLRDSQLEVKICIFMLSNHSGSMEPAFQRGDILFLNNQDSPIRVGEIVVFKIKDRDIPIVHRVMKVHEKEDGKVRKSDLFLSINTEDLVINHTAANYADSPSIKSNQIEVLTKGDNNRVDDRGLYAPGQLWLQREDILGRAKGTLRYLGMVTIILNDYPVLKYVLIGVMGLFVLTNKES
jgi:signal peptidase I